MKTEIVLLSQVKVNEANPRTITQKKLNLLAERMLAFPKMLDLRPVIVDNTMVALGGNMRTRALQLIAEKDIIEIKAILERTKNYQRLTKGEKDKLLDTWGVWLDKPTVTIAKASDLTDAEKQEFIIADNASFGEWDYDKLADQWDAKELQSWGVDVWAPDEGFSSAPSGGSSAVDPSALPAELQGKDINPDDLPKMEGSDETAMKRVIICYPEEREEEVAALLGLDELDKVVYSIDELGGEE